jgi:hypothetical protein
MHFRLLFRWLRLLLRLILETMLSMVGYCPGVAVPV